MDGILSPSAPEEKPNAGGTSPPAGKTMPLALEGGTETPTSGHSDLGGSHITKQARVLFTPPSKEEAPAISTNAQPVILTVSCVPTTPKPSTPKLSKAEREALRVEAKAKREAEKVKREQEKMKKEQEKKERKERREQEMKERQEKREKKEAERKKRDEEKKKSEMEKEMAKEEKTRKEQIVKQRFIGFFSKRPKEPPTKKTDVFLTPFSVKPDMILAQLPRPALQSTAELDTFLLAQDYTGSPYLTDIKGCRLSGKHRNGKKIDDDVIITWPPPLPQQPGRRKMKLLQFHTNYRPAYYGTWTKTSSQLSPRNPFKMDKALLDYEVDSDDEWEEEEPGESVSDSDGGEGEEGGEGGAEEGEDEDGFFVPHGYLSEGEGDQSDDEGGGEANEARKQKQLAKAKAWEAEFTRKCQQLKPRLVGPVWCTSSANGEDCEKSKDEAFLCQFEAMALVEGPITIGESSSSSSSSSAAAQTSTPSLSYTGGGEGTKRAVPEEAIPDLVRLVHCSPTGLMRLIKTFRMHWGTMKSGTRTTPSSPEALEQQSGISKRQLEFKIQTIAVKEIRPPNARPLWFVHESVFTKYGLDPSSIVPLAPLHSPSLAKQKPMLMNASSPETPVLVRKGLKRKTNGDQTVKALFEAVSKSPSSGKKEEELAIPRNVALQTTPTRRPQPRIITTLLAQSSPPVKKPRLESDWSDPQQLAKFAAQYIPQIIMAGLLTNGNGSIIPNNVNKTSNLVNENAGQKPADYTFPVVARGNTLQELTNTQPLPLL